MAASHEIQTLQDGRWRVNAVFESGDLALGKATSLAERPDAPPLRVVQEKFGGGGKSVLRVMYESSGHQAGDADMEEALNAAGLEAADDAGEVETHSRIRRVGWDAATYLAIAAGLAATGYTAFLVTLVLVT